MAGEMVKYVSSSSVVDTAADSVSDKSDKQGQVTMPDTAGRTEPTKYVFVCGMPRSGTTILATEIAAFENCTGFENTGVMMDEGQYLQNVYPSEWACGGAGRFGFDRRSHLTEASPLLTQRNVERLRRSWEAWWDKSKKIRVEKTPGNLLKTRFLQAAFPNAYFVLIKRHPVAVSLATQKWSRTPLHELFEHWLLCHEIFDGDKQHLARSYELSYEDYIENPSKYLSEIASFIGIEFSGSLKRQPSEGYNDKYLGQWTQMLESSFWGVYYRQVADEYKRRFAAYGYSLTPRSSTTARPAHRQGSTLRTPSRLVYTAADIHSAVWRADLWLRIRAHRVLKAKNSSILAERRL